MASLLLLSGGLDSSVALPMAKENCEIIFTITFDYGQKAAKQELRHAKYLSDFYGVPHRTLLLPWFQEFGSALLEQSSTLPQPSLSQLSSAKFTKDSAQAVWVPNRNGVFIEIAASFAESAGASELIVGFNEEEALTFPDNSRQYLNAINQALSYSTSNHVRVVSPTATLTKSEIVREAIRIDFPFRLLWSCYEDHKLMCGRCESCMRLKRALHQNACSGEGLFEYPEL